MELELIRSRNKYTLVQTFGSQVVKTSSDDGLWLYQQCCEAIACRTEGDIDFCNELKDQLYYFMSDNNLI